MEQFYREAQGSITNDRILVGYIIATFETSGFLSCAHKCLSCSSCKSYNYRPTSEERGVCEINSDEGDLEENFMNQKGSLFGRLTRQMVSDIHFNLVVVKR